MSSRQVSRKRIFNTSGFGLLGVIALLVLVGGLAYSACLRDCYIVPEGHHGIVYQKTWFGREAVDVVAPGRSLVGRNTTMELVPDEMQVSWAYQAPITKRSAWKKVQEALHLTKPQEVICVRMKGSLSIALSPEAMRQLVAPREVSRWSDRAKRTLSDEIKDALRKAEGSDEAEGMTTVDIGRVLSSSLTGQLRSPTRVVVSEMTTTTGHVVEQCDVVVPPIDLAEASTREIFFREIFIQTFLLALGVVVVSAVVLWVWPQLLEILVPWALTFG